MMNSGTPNFDFGYLHDHSRLTAYRQKPVDIGWFTETGRTPRLNLNGFWHFEIDPYDSGLRGEWFRERNNSDSSVGPPDCDFDAWDEVTVPGCWNIQRTDLKYYEGTAWYVRDFMVEEKRNGYIYPVAFGGTSGETIVFVNGEFCGYNDIPGAPFAADATDLLREGKNRIAVWVTNRRHEDGVPGEFYDWFNYGGIFRSVGLHRVPDVYIRRWKLSLGEHQCPELEISLNREIDLNGVVSVGNRKFPFRTDKKGTHTAVLDWSPELWHPDSPKLYDVKIVIGSDEISDRIGFRNIEADETGIRINGRRIVLKGLAVHEDHPETGRALTTEQRRLMLKDAVSMNANALRLAHYPHDGETARLADEAGILLWEEIPVYWHLDFANSETRRKARRLMKSLILRDENRASVILWSIGNENPDSDSRLSFMTNLADLCRSMDKTRLVTAACLVDVSSYRITDRLADVVDVVSVNEYYGWYYPGLERVGEIVRSRSDKPVMISEFGAGATYRAENGPAEPWSEEYQAEFYENQFRALSGISNLTGYFPWVLYDFPSPRRLNAHQRGFNRKGLITHNRLHRKKACETIRKWYESITG